MTNIKDDESLSHQVLNLLEKGYNRAEIENQLVEHGHDALFVKQMMFELKLLQTNRKRAQALNFIIAGASMCLLSFLLSFTPIYPHQTYYLALYGLASMGGLLVMAGVVMMFV